MGVWKMIVLFKQVMFRFHVNFPGCMKSEEPIPAMKWLTKLTFPHLCEYLKSSENTVLPNNHPEAPEELLDII